MRIWIAIYQSEHFTFTAFGETRKEAVDTLRRGLRKHGRQYKTTALDWYSIPLEDNANVFEVQRGQTIRDYDHAI